MMGSGENISDINKRMLVSHKQRQEEHTSRSGRGKELAPVLAQLLRGQIFISLYLYFAFQ